MKLEWREPSRDTVEEFKTLIGYAGDYVYFNCFRECFISGDLYQREGHQSSVLVLLKYLERGADPGALMLLESAPLTGSLKILHNL